MLLSTGEQMSVSLCAMAIEALGCSCHIPTGWQAAMFTNTVSRNARIKRVDTDGLRRRLNQRKIVIVTGFQESTGTRISTTLEGGIRHVGSGAGSRPDANCARFTRIMDGVYTADPRTVREPETG